MLALLATLLLAGPAPGQASAPHAMAAKSAASAWHPVVPFVEDDYPKAIALAKQRKLPVFIEGWAPW